MLDEKDGTFRFMPISPRSGGWVKGESVTCAGCHNKNSTVGASCHVTKIKRSTETASIKDSKVRGKTRTSAEIPFLAALGRTLQTATPSSSPTRL